jgi:hypothetical protein
MIELQRLAAAVDGCGEAPAVEFLKYMKSLRLPNVIPRPQRTRASGDVSDYRPARDGRRLPGRLCVVALRTAPVIHLNAANGRSHIRGNPFTTK